MTASNSVRMTHPRGMWLGGLLIVALAMNSSVAATNTPGGGQTKNPQAFKPSVGAPIQNPPTVKPAFGATTFQAQTIQVMPVPRQIIAGTLKWQCQANQCSASGSAVAGDACQALAAQVGALRSFNAGNQSLDGAALAKCNGVVAANRQPSPAGKQNPGSAPTIGAPIQNPPTVKPAFGATTFQAQTIQVMPVPRQIIAGTLKWQCQANQCSASGSAVAGDACQALAAQVGALRSFNAGNQSLDGAALAKCNGVVAANRQPSPADKHNSALGPTINAQGLAPRLAAVDIADRKIKFQTLQRNREQAATAARAKATTGTLRSGADATVYKGKKIPGASTNTQGQPRLVEQPLPRPGGGHPRPDGPVRRATTQWVKIGGTDCDDGRPDVNPLAAEICDGRDNNCDGAVDDGQTLPRYLDADGDGHGDPATRLDVCPSDISNAASRAATSGGGWLVEIGNDCDDSDPDRWRDCGGR